MLRAERGERKARAAAYAVVVLAAVYTVWLGHPELALAPGAPIRSDLGGHIVAVGYLRDVSLPSGHLLDWSHQWFAGYPSFYFYFPLPALAITAISHLVRLDVAAKVFAVAAPALLAPAIYAATRSSGFRRLHAAGAVVGTAAFLSYSTYYGLGGNVLSSIVGEYSYAVSLALALFYLKAVNESSRGQPRLAHMSLLLAGTALSHAVPTLFAVIASCAALRARTARLQVLASWAVGFGLAAFWALPFLLRSRYMGATGWAFPFDPELLLPFPVLLTVPWLIAGVITLWRSGTRPGTLALFGVAALISEIIPHTLFDHNRALPIAHVLLYALAGLGIAVGLTRALAAHRRLLLAFWTSGLVMLLGVSIVQMDFVRRRASILLTNAAPDTAAYRELAAQLQELPAGRVHSEYWTVGGGVLGELLSPGQWPAQDRQIRTTVGLLRQSALTSPAYYHLVRALSWDTTVAGRSHHPAPVDTSTTARLAGLRELGVDYLVTYSPEAKSWAAAQPGALRRLASRPDWTLWAVTGSSLVEPVQRVRNAVRGEAAFQWLEHLADSTVWVVPGRAGHALAPVTAGVTAGSVVSARLGHRRVEFQTSAVGIPHVVRVGYFPNWRAYGALGPFQVLPGFMLVVPARQAVTLRFESTWVERAGGIASLLTVMGLILLEVHNRRRRSRATRS